MRVLVTGGAGRIGKVQVETLRAAGHDVRSFDQKELDAKSDWEHIVADLRDFDRVREAVRGMDAVAHLGAIPGDTGQDHAIMETNVMGTWNVLQACVEHGVSRAVCFSSVQALGNVCGFRPTLYFPIDDSYPRHPMSPYQLSKHIGEDICRSFTERHGMVTICLRPVGVNWPERYERWRQTPRDDSNPSAVSNYWAYVDVRDVADATLKGLTIEGIGHDAFLLAADDTVSHTPTAELIERYYPQIPWLRLAMEEYLEGQPYRCPIDCSDAHEALGWRPRYGWRTPEAGELEAVSVMP